MTQDAIVPFNQNGIEVYIDTTTGESFCSVRGYARMSGMAQSTISSRVSRLKGERKAVLKTSKSLTAGGFQGVRLICEDLIIEWLPKDNPEVATKMMKAGVRVFLHRAAGYEVKSTAIAQPKTPTTYLEALKALVASEEQKVQLEAENQLLEEENEQLAEAVDELFDYSSIVRIAKFNSISEKNFAWRKLKAATLSLGLSVKQVPCPRFGHKNLYPHAAWKIVYPDAALPEPTTIRVSS